MNATSMLAQQSKMLKYYAQAQRYLDERDRLEDATDKEIEALAHALRYEDFKRAIEPYERSRKAILLKFFMLQAHPFAPVPESVKEAVASYDEMIAGVAKEFGYEPTSFSEPK